MTPQRGEIWCVNLELMQEAALRKMQSYLVLTANTLNRLRQTVIVVPLPAAARAHPPITVPMMYQGKTTVAIIDQLRTVAKHRVHSMIETASPARIQAILTALTQIFEMT
jgi:mRNA-degrading endonuclease toxin of MazEF toxin-antitoxin module